MQECEDNMITRPYPRTDEERRHHQAIDRLIASLATLDMCHIPFRLRQLHSRGIITDREIFYVLATLKRLPGKQRLAWV